MPNIIKIYVYEIITQLRTTAIYTKNTFKENETKNRIEERRQLLKPQKDKHNLKLYKKKQKNK